MSLFFLRIAALLLSCSSCIRAAAAATISPAPAPPLDPQTSPACPFLISSSCPSRPPHSSWPPDATLFVNMSLPIILSNQPFLFLSPNLSSSSTFTINFTNEFFENCPPILSLTLTQSPPLSIQLIFDFRIQDSCTAANQSSLLWVCKSKEPYSQKPTNSSCMVPSQPDSEDITRFDYAVLLTYDADSAVVHVQAVVKYGGELDINQTFLVNTTDLQPDADDAKGFRDESMVFFVGGFTRGNATININTINDASLPLIYRPVLIDPLPSHRNNFMSKYTKVVVWVLVGVSLIALLVVLVYLASSIKRHYGWRLPLVSSRLAGGHVIFPHSTTTRTPFSHHHLESQSNATPMVGALPFSRLDNTNDFQISTTPSWLKQPNPR